MAVFAIWFLIVGPTFASDVNSTGPSPPSFEFSQWNVHPPGSGTLRFDQNGQPLVSLSRTSEDAGRESLFSGLVRLDPKGTKLTVRGRTRTDLGNGTAALWLRAAHGPRVNATAAAAFPDTLEASIAVGPDVSEITIGFSVTGNGRAELSEIELLVDGVPLQAVKRGVTPKASEMTTTGLDVQPLSHVQLENLLLLGKVWGFLKYHHSYVTDGTHDWDSSLIPIARGILLARSRRDAQQTLTTWVNTLPPVRTKRRDKESSLPQSTAWIKDEKALGKRLSTALQRVFDSRSLAPRQRYVAASSNGSLEFTNEATYPGARQGDLGFRLITFYRLWNVVRYWYAYNAKSVSNWDAASAAHLGRLLSAATHDEYVRELFSFTASLGDSHTSLWNAISIQPPEGRCRVNVDARVLADGRVFVGLNASAGPDLRPGDELIAVNGEPVKTLMAARQRFYAGSNDGSRLRDVANALTKGDCVPVTLRVQRSHEEAREVTLERARLPRAAPTHERAGPALQKLRGGVCYWKGSLLQADQIKGLVQQCLGAPGVVVDLRSYPADYVVYALAGHLADRQAAFARAYLPDLTTPGSTLSPRASIISPLAPLYPGRLAVLIDEVTQSQAEYTAMALRAVGRARLFGSATAGADGDISLLVLPGELSTAVSTVGISYPNGASTQRVGVLPDVHVFATEDGLRAGLDQTLEAAVNFILRPEVDGR